MTEKSIQEKVKEYQDRVAEKNQGLPEAGAIAYSTVYVGNFPINLTQRAGNVYDAYVAFKMGIDLLGEVFGVTLEKDVPKAQPPVKSKVAEQLREQGEDEFADAFEQTDVPPAPDGKTWLTVNADVIKILPQPDDKVTLEFYETGKQYPVIKVNKWKIADAQGLLKHVTSQDVSKAAEVKLDGLVVYYLEGKEGKTATGTTFKWKNVSHVRLA